MACADDLIMALREYMVEIKLIRQDVHYLRSLFNSRPDQQVSKHQSELIKEMISSLLDSEKTFTNESTTSTSRRSGMHEPDTGNAPLNAANKTGYTMTDEFMVEQAFQTTRHTLEGTVVMPMLFPPQRVQATGDACAIRQLPPLPEKLIRTPKVGPQLRALDNNVTTLIIRSIPPKLSQEDLIALWPPTWGYNFLHIPYNPKQRRLVGYSFINFFSNETAKLFYSRWEGQVLEVQGHTQTLCVQVARIQGLRANLKHLLSQGIHQVKNEKHLPAIFDGVYRNSFRALVKELERMQECPTAAWCSFSLTAI